MSSSVPVVLPAFKALATTALPAGSQVWTGSVMPVQQPGPGDVTGIASGAWLQIKGIHFDADQFAEMGPTYKHEEHYNIECELCVWRGGGNYDTSVDFDQCVQDVYAVYADLTIALGNQIRLNQTDPNVPRLAWPRQLSLVIAPDALGRPSACIDFEVQVQARVTSQS